MPDKNCVIHVRVPAKIMLSGEYAVMSGFSSLSLALNKYLTIRIERSFKECSIVTSLLWEGPYFFERVEELQDSEDILLSSLYSVLKEKKLGNFDFFITSDFCVSSGFGSSSALRLGVQYALHLFEKALNKEELIIPSSRAWGLAEKAFQEQKKYQKKASGYDFITQKEGGVVLYKPKNSSWPNKLSKLDFCSQRLKRYLHIFIGGSGALTKEVMNKTDAWLSQNQLKEKFFELSEKLSLSFSEFFESKKEILEKELISLISQHRSLMRHSPFFPSFLEEALKSLDGFDHTWTFKTTGSGGEDALLFFGREENLCEAKKVLLSLGWYEESCWNLDQRGIQYGLSLQEIGE